MSKSKESAAEDGGGGHDGGGMLRWLLTYADMITLLMAFFIMMYAMSVLDLKKFQELAVSVRSGFGVDVKELKPAGKTPGGATPAPLSLPFTSGKSLITIGAHVRADIKKAGLLQKVRITSQDDKLIIRMMADGLFFDRGSADLRRDVRVILNAVASAVRDIPTDIRVEGHTCDLPISTPRFPSNWELSAARAINCVVYLAKNCRISPRRLSAVGYADTRPLVPNTCEANRKKNRRVDLFIVSTQDVAPSPRAAPSSHSQPPVAVGAGPREFVSPAAGIPPGRSQRLEEVRSGAARVSR